MPGGDGFKPGDLQSSKHGEKVYADGPALVSLLALVQDESDFYDHFVLRDFSVLYLDLLFFHPRAANAVDCFRNISLIANQTETRSYRVNDRWDALVSGDLRRGR